MSFGPKNIGDWLKIAGFVITTLAMGAGVIGSYAVAQSKIDMLERELLDNSESIDENEEALILLQQMLIQQQGTQAVELEQLRGDVKLILRLLEQLRTFDNQ